MNQLYEEEHTKELKTRMEVEIVKKLFQTTNQNMVNE
jgi:hypothetical protein